MKKRTVKKINEMSESITDVEIAFGTIRYLPKYNPGFKIPDCEKIAEGIFFGNIPRVDVIFRDGIDQSKFVNRLLVSHLKSFEPKHEHKIYGVAYLIWEATESITIK